jgi:hypothetical protein
MVSNKIQQLLSFATAIAPKSDAPSAPKKDAVHERIFEFMKMAASPKEIRRALNLLNFGHSPDDAIKRMVQKGSTEDDAIAAVLTAVEQLKPEEPLEGPETERAEPSFEDEPDDFGMFETVEKEKVPEPEGQWGEKALRDILMAGDKKTVKRTDVCDSLLAKLAKAKETPRKSVDKSLQKVKKDYAQYKSEYDKLESEKKKLDSKLDSLKEKLDKAKESYLELSEDSKNMDIHNADGCGYRKGPDGNRVKFYTKDNNQYVVDENNSLKSLKDLFTELRAKKQEEQGLANDTYSSDQ